MKVVPIIVGAGISGSGNSGELAYFSGNSVMTGVPGSIVGAAGNLALATGAVVVSTPILAMTQTWNAGGVGFTAVDLNVTNTASTLATSFLLNLRVGGASVFAVRRDGLISPAVVTSGSMSAGGSSAYNWNGRSQFQSGADGNIVVMNAAANDFGLFQFGGTTASFPALKRTTTQLRLRLADDSADTDIIVRKAFATSYLVSQGAAASEGAGTVVYGATTASTVGAAGGASALPATPLGYIIINVAGTAAKLPYYNN